MLLCNSHVYQRTRWVTQNNPEQLLHTFDSNGKKNIHSFKTQLFSQQSKDRARLFGSSKVPGNVSPAKPTQIQLVQNPVSISHHHTLHPASPDSLSLLRERSRTQAMPASLHLKGKVAKKKILNELLWVPLHFHQYKQVATVNEFLY